LWTRLGTPCLALLWLGVLLPQASAVSTDPGPAKGKAKEEAKKFARAGQWAKACAKYDEAIRLDRNDAESRTGFRECLRRYQQLRRHRDPSYQRLIAAKGTGALPYSQALILYRVMLEGLQRDYVDKTKPVPRHLFLRGKEEFRTALADRDFLKAHTKARPRDLDQFRAKLARGWNGKNVTTVNDAVNLVRDIAMTAQKAFTFGGLELNATLVVLEFACGACASLDQYTFYLTPGQFGALFNATKAAKVIGVGIDLVSRESKLVISRVWRGSPAEAAGLKVEDQVTRIGKKPAAGLTPDTARELLKGDIGTTVELEVASPGTESRSVALKRQKLIPTSVEYGWLWEKSEMTMDPGKQTELGYVQITHFRKSTPRELDAALLFLRDGGMKGLILDLRGNRGGSFEAGVDCARRFLTSGIIVSTKDRDGKVKDHLVRNGTRVVPLPDTLPVVVLIDRYTESSAEVLAAALKERPRTKLVGQTTFGKGCSQTFLCLKTGDRKLVGAICITVEKFFSPKTGDSYHGRGIEPDTPVEDDDAQLAEARKILNEEIERTPPMRPMMNDPM
jgi:carboxyl-terminal processing protease